MTQQIQGKGISDTWLSAFEYLLGHGGVAINLVATVSMPGMEDEGVRQVFDKFLADRRTHHLLPISTVANTLFPETFYHPELGTAAAPFLYDRYLQSYPLLKRRSRSGTYFQRLIAWPGGGEPVNQLARVIERLKSGMAKKRVYKSAYEIAVTDIEGSSESASVQDAITCTEARLYEPKFDNTPRGFPCLSHLSFTLLDNKLHLTATYRSQYFISKAYGNFVGLSRLMRFVCLEAGCQPGELVCIATLANAEVGSQSRLGANDLKHLANACRCALTEEL